ncbi:MAG TPA: fibronectin type III domain-containing protein [Terriglobia bacterium]|jgi:hypothetical protein
MSLTVLIIKALINFRRLTAEALLTASMKVCAELLNPNFTLPQAPAPPVDQPTLKSANDTLSTTILAAKDGGKKDIAARDKASGTVVYLLTQLAHYVEANCKGDMTIFLSSGFQAAPSTRTQKPPVSESFRSLTPGPEHGVMKTKLVKIAGAVSYLVQWGVVPPGGGTPASWTTLPIARVRSATTITGLTPATTYAFQARRHSERLYRLE